EPVPQGEPSPDGGGSRTYNGRKAINCRLAFTSYPAERLPPAISEKYPVPVRFKWNGFPDFGVYVKREVTLKGLDGTRADIRRANIAAGFHDEPKPPKGYTWHHVEDGETMQLVPAD